MNRRTFLLSSSVALSASGCAAIAKVIEVILPLVVEAAEILDAIDAKAQVYFKANPDPETESTYGQIMSRAKLALSAITRAAKGAQSAEDQDLDAAFIEFRQAYSDILALLGPFGIVAPSTDGTFSAAVNDGPLMVPAADMLVLP